MSKTNLLIVLDLQWRFHPQSQPRFRLFNNPIPFFVSPFSQTSSKEQTFGQTGFLKTKITFWFVDPLPSPVPFFSSLPTKDKDACLIKTRTSAVVLYILGAARENQGEGSHRTLSGCPWQFADLGERYDCVEFQSTSEIIIAGQDAVNVVRPVPPLSVASVVSRVFRFTGRRVYLRPSDSAHLTN